MISLTVDSTKPVEMRNLDTAAPRPRDLSSRKQSKKMWGMISYTGLDG